MTFTVSYLFTEYLNKCNIYLQFISLKVSSELEKVVSLDGEDIATHLSDGCAADSSDCSFSKPVLPGGKCSTRDIKLSFLEGNYRTPVITKIADRQLQQTDYNRLQPHIHRMVKLYIWPIVHRTQGKIIVQI